MIIAIDGPAASGKSTTAKLVAKKLNIIYLDTGAMYRTVTLQLLRSNVNLGNSYKVSTILDNMIIDMYDYNGKNVVKLKNEDVSELIRSTDVTKHVSKVSSLSEVRKSMVAMQREIGNKSDCVVEGRDIGTIVFPNAEYKFYIVADIKMRAQRRLKELEQIGIIKSLDDVMLDLKVRDHKDSNRDNSPLRKADDAVQIDTSNLSIYEQVNFIINHLNNN